jgi:hypothetical protein
MKLRAITLLILLLFTVNISTTSKANTETLVIEGATKIIEGLGKIETATKGKKLQKFFSGNTLRLLIDEKTKEYKFQEKTYEVFEDGKSIESGKWKVSGLLKNQIKLNADGNSKAYYLKKINKKEILYHFDNSPSKKNTIKTLVTIEPLIKKEETKVVKKKEEPKVVETKVVKKKEEPKVVETKVVKKKIKKKKITTETSDEKIVNILVVNLQSLYPAYYLDGVFTLRTIQQFITFEIDFERGFIYSTLSESNNPKGKRKFKSKDKILSYDDNKGELIAVGKPYIYVADQDNLFHPLNGKSFKLKDIDKKEIKYTFYYKAIYSEEGNMTNGHSYPLGTLRTVIKGKKFMNVVGGAYPDNYLSDKKNPETYANIDGKPKVWDREKLMEAKSLNYKKTMAATKARLENLEKEIWAFSPIREEEKENLRRRKVKSNKYGSSQLEQTKKIVNSVTKEDFKTYNVTSLISYYFFDSMSNYMESLEFLYRAYDKNTDADKLKAQIAYLKSSKGSEKERLESTKQIINSASLEVQADVQDESIVLSDEAKINYQKALPFAFKATDSGYKLFVVSKGLVTEIKGSGNLLGTLLKNANELKGAGTVVPLIPDYIKKVGGTAKLIFSGAKTKKIKDKENLSAALDELDLSA